MRLLITLTAASLICVGCAKSGENADGGSVQAKGVTGVYAVKATRPNGDIIIMFSKFSGGQYEAFHYKFTAGNMAKSSYVKLTASDVVSGNIHNVITTYATCSILNGITTPSSDAFPVTPLGNNQILVHSNLGKLDILMDKIDSMEQSLADLGTYLAVEVTDCAAAF